MHKIFEDVNNHPVKYELFCDLAKIVLDGMGGRMRALPPDAERDFSKPGLYLKDIPINQASIAVIQECANRFGQDGSRDVSLSFMMRWMALSDLKTAGVWTNS